MNLPACLLAGLSLVALGYGIANADRVSAAWMLHHECVRVAIAESEIMSGGFVEIEENSEMWRCNGGVMK